MRMIRILREAGAGDAGAGGGGAGAGSPPPGAGAGASEAGTGTPGTGTPPDFRSSWNPEYREHPALKDYKDINGVLKSHVELQKMVGTNRLPMPQADWKPEQYAELFNKLGRPEKAEGYQLPKMEVPAGVELDPAMEQHFRGKLHGLNLTQSQYEGVYKEFIGYLGTQAEAETQARDKFFAEATESLKKEWGDKYDGNVAMAQKAYDTLGGQEVKALFDKHNLSNNPQVIKFMANLGAKMGEDSATGNGNGQMGGITAAQAEAEIKQLSTNPEFRAAFTGARHPGHAEAVQKWAKLHEIIHGNKPVDAA